jgi:hypothetical protein
VQERQRFRVAASVEAIIRRDASPPERVFAQNEAFLAGRRSSLRGGSEQESLAEVGQGGRTCEGDVLREGCDVSLLM